jgi:BNR/Asp-box repeat
MKLLLTIAGAVALSAVAAAPHLAPPPGNQVITLTDVGYFSEPSVAIDLQNPANAVVAYQFAHNVTYTRDHGKTWHPAHTPPAPYRIAGDVSVVYNARGEALLSYLSFQHLGSPYYWAHNAPANGVFVLRSPDGGKTWTRRAVTLALQKPNDGRFEDKPYLVADATHSRFRGNVYIGWAHYTLAASEIVFARSRDGGVTWSRPMRISTVNGLPRDDNGNVNGFSGAVSPDGTLSVVWAGPRGITFTRSHDGGKSFERSRAIIPMPSSVYDINGFESRSGNGFPQIAAGRNRTLFVSWSDYRNGEIDVFSSTSRDGGDTWSAAVKVNDDAVHNAKDHFLNWMTVDPVSGFPYVVFADRRYDAENMRFTVSLARSTDDGCTYRNYAWTTTPSDPQQQFIGDYTGIAAYNGWVYGAWTEARAAFRRRMAVLPHTVVRLGIARF